MQVSRLLVVMLLMVHAYSLYSMRASSYPFISGDSFRAHCDHIFDETSNGINPYAVKDGQTIFLKADSVYIVRFFRDYYPKINAHFIVVSHNGDHSIPGLRNESDLPPPGFNLLHYLDNPDCKVIIWFGQNIDTIHPKLKPIPIGVANRCWPHGDIDNLRFATRRVLPWKERLDKIYLNISVGTNRRLREPALNYFSNKSFCSHDIHRSHRDYLLEMKKYKFILCPPGNGMDCHRIWEALLVGSIPIVYRSTLDSLYADLPIIIVDDWAQVTPDFLRGKEEEFGQKVFMMEKIYFDYWRKQIDVYKHHTSMCGARRAQPIPDEDVVIFEQK